MNTRELRRGEQLQALQRKLAAAEQMRRESFGMPKIEHAIDRTIRNLKRKIKRLFGL